MTSENQNEEEKISPFELKLTEFSHQSGSIPVTWCISEETLESYTWNSSEIYVLLATGPKSPDGNLAEWRGYANLKDLVAYVTFLRPGDNVIIARLGRRQDIKSWMERSRGRWESRVIDYPPPWEFDEARKKGWTYRISCEWFSRYTDSVNINMSTGSFAKEPSQWEKDWVNFFWKEKSVDQCEFRRRRMLAYGVQPFLFVPFIALRLVLALSFFLVGFRNISFKPFLYPATYSTNDIFPDKMSNRFVFHSLGNPLAYIVHALMFLSFCLFIVLSLLGFDSVNFYEVLNIFTMFGASYLFVSLSIYLLSKTFVGPGIGNLITKFETYLWNINNKRSLNIMKKKREKHYNQTKEIVCSNVGIITKISDLPPKKRTIKLKFQDIKSRSCKPFAR